MKVQSKSTLEASREARHSEEISPHKIATAQSWQERSSVFNSLDESLCLDENIEELRGVEQRNYWSIHGGTDLSRAEFENRETEAGLARNPPPGVEPLDHWRNELKKDQEENNDDYRRRPAGNEVVSTTQDRTGGEVRKEDRAGLAKWSKALLAAEGITNEAALKNIRRRKKVKAQRARINKEERRKKRRIAEKTGFEKAIEIAPKYGVPPQVILARKQDKYVETTTRTTCTIPNAGQAAAAFCSRLTSEARKLERRKTRRGKEPDQKIIDRDREMARLAFEAKSIEVTAGYLDDVEFSTPTTWKKPKYAPKGEKFTTGIRVQELRQSFFQMVSRAKKKYPSPTPS